MARIDMTSRELHELIRPVLPHVVHDADLPQLDVVRLECAPHAVYAVATDRYTLAAERFVLPGEQRVADVPPPVHLGAAEVKAALRLFPHSKDFDPKVRVTIETRPVPVSVAGRPTTVDHLAVTIESDEGTRLVLHDIRDPSSDPLGVWRQHLLGALTRDQPAGAPALTLHAHQLGRWGAAVRKGERLAVFTGSQGDQMVLVLVEDHFCGVWMPVSYIDGPEKMRDESPWITELPGVTGG